MLKIGDTITIRYSKKLQHAGNTVLSDREGIVTRIVMHGGKMQGAYVNVRVNKRMRNYYVPECSIEGVGEINKLRNLAILKSTIL